MRSQEDARLPIETPCASRELYKLEQILIDPNLVMNIEGARLQALDSALEFRLASLAVIDVFHPIGIAASPIEQLRTLVLHKQSSQRCSRAPRVKCVALIGHLKQ
jgi:hypothetical protein